MLVAIVVVAMWMGYENKEPHWSGLNDFQSFLMMNQDCGGNVITSSISMRSNSSESHTS